MIQNLLNSSRWPIGINPILLNNNIDKNQSQLYTNSDRVLWIDKEEFDPIECDTVIVFDVIDHINEDSFMSKIIPLCKGKDVFWRVHPYTSRLATHATDINKALAHLFLDIGIHHNKKNKHQDYVKLFKQYGFSIITHEKYYHELEDIFYAPMLRKTIESKLQMGLDDKNIEVQFIDYHLALT